MGGVVLGATGEREVEIYGKDYGWLGYGDMVKEIDGGVWVSRGVGSRKGIGREREKIEREERAVSIEESEEPSVDDAMNDPVSPSFGGGKLERGGTQVIWGGDGGISRGVDMGGVVFGATGEVEVDIDGKDYGWLGYGDMLKEIDGRVWVSRGVGSRKGIGRGKVLILSK
ncbi:hypothetical protein HAX54_029175 [Datura stramonium]|uniref:Uncharacterized protein n=1 Tax=Datura stramonium TaxID=4076 RepID=A0ABS8SA24_DATST|nr:hypothetical protein [Datura stramonium]